jgi:hypothetical protein
VIRRALVTAAVVLLPAGAGAAADPPPFRGAVAPIPPSLRAGMTSWRAGCPVSPGGLRLLTVSHWGFDGRVRQGKLLVATSAARPMVRAMRALYEARFPIRRMRLVEAYGSDDDRSMAADNTSAFNCRGVVGNPGVRSPHSWGRSLDLNPWENPYRSRQGWTPNTWWVGRSHPRVAWRSRSHEVVQVMARHGLRWTYGTSDAHHFDAGGNSARMMARWSACGDGVVCK